MRGAIRVALAVGVAGAVGLQAAAVDPRIRLVVAHAPFVDLETAVSERASFVAKPALERVLRRAEVLAGFRVDDVSPLHAASQVRVPVLLLHGTEDRETPPPRTRAPSSRPWLGPRSCIWWRGLATAT